MTETLPLAGSTSACLWIEVSSEMTAVLGHACGGGFPTPDDSVAIAYSLGGEAEQAAVRFGFRATHEQGITLFVARATLARLGAADDVEASDFHLTSELRAVALALRDGSAVANMNAPYRLAKSIELLCETIAQLGAGRLVPLAAEGDMTMEDARRVLAARTLIDERWCEKLTLDGIARACAINRTKLTRGFREMFDCTIAEALAERRLGHARRMLLTTDKPVSSIGYENGYLNNASFARAFSRRFGEAPSSLRQRIAA